jgi:predicted dehydrogenase
MKGQAPEPLRAALVGCGAIAWRGLIPAWLPESYPKRPKPAAFLDFGAAEGLVITALCDSDPVALSRASSVLPKARLFGSWQSVMDQQGDLDVILIATPNSLHEPQAIAALRAGFDIFVEKPVARSHLGLSEICRLEEEDQRVTMVHLPWRFQPEARALVSWVQEGRIGEVLRLYGEFRHGGPRHWSPNAEWYFDPDNAGGCLSDLGPHLLDLMCLLGGHPQLISIQRSDRDQIVCEMRFPEGKEGTICTGWDREQPVFQVWAMGTHGMIGARLDGPNRGILYSQHTPRDGSGDLRRAVADHSWSALGASPPAGARKPAVGPYAHFVECVRRRRRPETSVLRLQPVEELLLEAVNTLGK